MKLYFENSQGKERLIAEVANEKEAFKEIHKFLDDHNYKSYYTRYWNSGEITIFDVGSWSECFKLAAAGDLPAERIVGSEADFVDKKEK